MTALRGALRGCRAPYRAIRGALRGVIAPPYRAIRGRDKGGYRVPLSRDKGRDKGGYRAPLSQATPMVPHCHPKDHSPLSAVLEGGDFEGGGLWVAEGGLLWGGEKGRKTKCATKVCSGRDVVGGVHPARRGVIFSSYAFHCPAQWTGDRWSIVLFNGGNIDGASQDSLERLDDLGFKLPCGLPCGGWNCGVNTCN